MHEVVQYFTQAAGFHEIKPVQRGSLTKVFRKVQMC